MKLTKEQIFGAYLGQGICFPDSSKDTLEGVTIKGEVFGEPKYDGIYGIDNCKLILRTQDDMTEEEINMFYKLYDDIQSGYNAQHTEYLISIGIDVFGLIGRGWAVRESEVNK